MRDHSAWARPFIVAEPAETDEPELVSVRPIRYDTVTSYAKNLPSIAREERVVAVRALRTRLWWCVGAFLSTPLTGPVGLVVGVVAGVTVLFALSELSSTQIQVTLLDELRSEHSPADACPARKRR